MLLCSGWRDWERSNSAFVLGVLTTTKGRSVKTRGSYHGVKFRCPPCGKGPSQLRQHRNPLGNADIAYKIYSPTSGWRISARSRLWRRGIYRKARITFVCNGRITHRFDLDGESRACWQSSLQFNILFAVVWRCLLERFYFLAILPQLD